MSNNHTSGTHKGADTDAAFYAVCVHTLHSDPLIIKPALDTNCTTLRQLRQMIESEVSKGLFQGQYLFHLGDVLCRFDCEENHEETGADLRIAHHLDVTLRDLGLPFKPIATLPEEQHLQQAELIETGAAHLYIGTDAAALYDKLEGFKNGLVKSAGTSDNLLKLEKCSYVERRFIHRTAEQLGLYHQTIGKGSNRYIVVKRIREGVDNHLASSMSKWSTSTLRKHQRLEKKITGMSTIINDFLYLGAGIDANNVKQLAQAKIGAILNVACDWREPLHLAQTGIVYKKMDIKDVEHEAISDRFEEAIEFILQAKREKKRILVHCVIGKSRSASVILAYLMKAEGMRLGDAYEMVKKRRSIIRPNTGFIRQLMTYEESLHGSISLKWEFGETSTDAQRRVMEWKHNEKESKNATVLRAINHLITDQAMADVLRKVQQESKVHNTLPSGTPSTAVPKYLISDFITALVDTVLESIGSATGAQQGASKVALDSDNVRAAVAAPAKKWCLQHFGTAAH